MRSKERWFVDFLFTTSSINEQCCAPEIAFVAKAAKMRQFLLQVKKTPDQAQLNLVTATLTQIQ